MRTKAPITSLAFILAFSCQVGAQSQNPNLLVSLSNAGNIASIVEDEANGLSGINYFAQVGKGGTQAVVLLKQNGAAGPPSEVTIPVDGGERVYTIDGIKCGWVFFTYEDLDGLHEGVWQYGTSTIKRNLDYGEFGRAAGDPYATYDYIDSFGVFRGGIYSSQTDSRTDFHSNSLGVYAGPISPDFVSSFHGFFYTNLGNGSYTYNYQDEIHFGLTDLNPTLVPIVPGPFGLHYYSDELGDIGHDLAVGSIGGINPDYSYAAWLPAIWGLDVAGKTIGAGSLLPDPSYLPGSAESVNSSDQIVGSLGGHAYKWVRNSHGVYQAIDLNSLITPGDGWVLTDANQIDDSGNIYGVGTLNGTPSAFKLAAVPEPLPVALLALGGLALLRKKNS